METWDVWVSAALSKLSAKHLLRATRPISLAAAAAAAASDLRTFDGPCDWDRSSVEVKLSDATLRNWLRSLPGGESLGEDEKIGGKLVLFSGNDYLGLSAHPAVRNATSRAAEEHGMGPRGSALICGYTDYHYMLEEELADLKKKEDCLLCPTGFAANMAFISALGNISSLLATGRKPSKDERIAIFSDALNHASIIDGIRLTERLNEAQVFVYRHSDMLHLDTLLSCCKVEKKVVITDSLFSMDGDFAHLVDLVKLRRNHKFLLVIDDAHATLVCGKNGGGLPEVHGCEDDVDICIGTLSKAAGCHGGFIACSNKWKQLIQSRGRAFIFSTALPVPMAAASLAAIIVGRKENWRRREIWRRVQDFCNLTGLKISSPIISLVVGNEKCALEASRHLLKSGFHVTAIRPPTVPPDSCRLRVTLCAVHTYEDIKRLVKALSFCIKFPAAQTNSVAASRL